MKSLCEIVEKEHHVKHWGRLQLGLFFKAVGVSLEEAITYWRSNFTKKAGVDGTRVKAYTIFVFYFLLAMLKNQTSTLTNSFHLFHSSTSSICTISGTCTVKRESEPTTRRTAVWKLSWLLLVRENTMDVRFGTLTQHRFVLSWLQPTFQLKVLTLGTLSSALRVPMSYAIFAISR